MISYYSLQIPCLVSVKKKYFYHQKKIFNNFMIYQNLNLVLRNRILSIVGTKYNKALYLP